MSTPGSHVQRWEGAPPPREEIAARFTDEGLESTSWSNGPGDRYGWHDHAYHKVLYCVSGSIEFHTSDGDVTIHAGDRLEIDPGTRHAATVGPDGVTCMEAAREARQ